MNICTALPYVSYICYFTIMCRARATLTDTLFPYPTLVRAQYHEHAFDIPEALRIGAGALAAFAVWFHWWEPWPRFSVIGVAGLLIGGWPIFKEAIENLLARRMTMELSMTIAIVAAAAISEFFTALMITVLDRKSTRLNSSH